MFVRLLIHGFAHMWRGVVRKALELFAFGHGLDHLTNVQIDILYAPAPSERCRRYRRVRLGRSRLVSGVIKSIKIPIGPIALRTCSIIKQLAPRRRSLSPATGFGTEQKVNAVAIA
jgi:hypothetical protein